MNQNGIEPIYSANSLVSIVAPRLPKHQIRNSTYQIVSEMGSNAVKPITNLLFLSKRFRTICGKLPKQIFVVPARSGEKTRNPIGKICLCLIALQLLLVSTGCVQRRLQIRSQPEGALVSIDRQPVGLSPVSVPYTYHGTREFQLEKDGFKTVRVQQNIQPPWFDRFPISFFSNHFAGREIRDERLFDFQLEPKEPVNEAVLFDRANEFRSNIQRGTLTAPVNR